MQGVDPTHMKWIENEAYEAPELGENSRDLSPLRPDYEDLDAAAFGVTGINGNASTVGIGH